MASFKQDKVNVYTLKHAHLRKEKEKRCKAREELSPKIEKMDANQLLFFMENNFDHLVNKNNEVIINKTVFQRVDELCKQFDKKNFEEYYDFLQKGGIKIPQQEAQTMRIKDIHPRGVLISNQYFYSEGKNQLNLIYRVVIHPNSVKRCQKAYFAAQFKPTADYQYLIKRIKKGSIQVLKRLIETINKLQKMNN